MRPVVTTIGSFDMLHVGHVNLLRKCREIAGDGGTVVVGVNTDEFVERFKGRAPVVNQHDRMTMLRACRYVDHVVSNMGDEDGGKVIDWTDPDIIVIGDDWAPPRDYLGQLGITAEWLRLRGIEIRYLARTPNVSTTALRERANASSAGHRQLVRGSGAASSPTP